MSYSLDQAVSDAISKQYAPQEINKEQLGALWQNTAVFIRDNLSSKKVTLNSSTSDLQSVKLSDIGTFGFSEVKQNGKVSLQAKFIISPTFAKSYGIATQTGAILQSNS